VSLQRIQALLVLDEVEGIDDLQLGAGVFAAGVEGYKAVTTDITCAPKGSGGEVELTSVAGGHGGCKGQSEDGEFVITSAGLSATWQAEDASGTDSESFVLSDLTYSVRHGELVLVIGSVGCAKTSLLMTMLQELTPCRGAVSLHSRPGDGLLSTGYCAQEPWIMSSNIRSNILFGRDMDQKWYDEVVQACALTQDFALLPRGDETIIGDRGVNLSGGQRARVGLARAVYGRATLNLLDDPLSAVDPKVSSQLFHNAICGTMDGLSRVLVTHQTQYVSSPHVSRVMIMDRGRIVAFDTYAALEQSGELSRWVDVLETQKRRRASSAVSTESVDMPLVPVVSVDMAPDAAVPEDVQLAVSEVGTGTDDVGAPNTAKGEVLAGITAQEDKAEGSIGWESYHAYGEFVGSGTVLAGLVFVLVLGQVC